MSNHRHIARTAQLLCCACVLLLSACVSTDELYAEYDAGMCKFIVEKQVGDTQIVRELYSNTLHTWLPVVFFDYDTAILSADTIEQLQDTLHVMTKVHSARLAIQGFADHRGSITYNRDLAFRRAHSVQQWLVKNGIDINRISLRAMGEGLPSFDIDEDKSRAYNRRVELLLLDDQGLPVLQTYDPEGE